jgi:hypothetical protein
METTTEMTYLGWWFLWFFVTHDDDDDDDSSVDTFLNKQGGLCNDDNKQGR